MDEQRKKIDRIDRTLLRLLDERMELAEIIGKIKGEKGLPVYDAAREAEVLQKLRSLPARSIGNDEVQELFQHIIRISRRHGERGMRR